MAVGPSPLAEHSSQQINFSRCRFDILPDYFFITVTKNFQASKTQKLNLPQSSGAISSMLRQLIT
jgi:hypothetical protein